MSNFKPFAMLFSNSSWDFKTLEVVQPWVKMTPFAASTYLPSMSPLMAADLESRKPATLKVTFELEWFEWRIEKGGINARCFCLDF